MIVYFRTISYEPHWKCNEKKKCQLSKSLFKKCFLFKLFLFVWLKFNIEVNAIKLILSQKDEIMCLYLGYYLRYDLNISNISVKNRVFLGQILFYRIGSWCENGETEMDYFFSWKKVSLTLFECQILAFVPLQTRLRGGQQFRKYEALKIWDISRIKDIKLFFFANV